MTEKRKMRVGRLTTVGQVTQRSSDGCTDRLDVVMWPSLTQAGLRQSSR
jgi:hypothetical protein